MIIIPKNTKPLVISCKVMYIRSGGYPVRVRKGEYRVRHGECRVASVEFQKPNVEFEKAKVEWRVSSSQ